MCILHQARNHLGVLIFVFTDPLGVLPSMMCQLVMLQGQPFLELWTGLGRISSDVSVRSFSFPKTPLRKLVEDVDSWYNTGPSVRLWGRYMAVIYDFKHQTITLTIVSTKSNTGYLWTAKRQHCRAGNELKWKWKLCFLYAYLFNKTEHGEKPSFQML